MGGYERSVKATNISSHSDQFVFATWMGCLSTRSDVEADHKFSGTSFFGQSVRQSLSREGVLRYGTQSWQELSVDVESPSTKKQVVAL